METVQKNVSNGTKGYTTATTTTTAAATASTTIILLLLLLPLHSIIINLRV